MKQYPIWNTIDGQGKKASADFGSYNGFTQTIRVGAGARNSHVLACLAVRTWFDPQERRHFVLTVDGKDVAHGVYEPTTKEFNHKTID